MGPLLNFKNIDVESEANEKGPKSSYEESMEDIKAGRITTWESTDAYFRAMKAKKLTRNSKL
ncbi:MAG: hypothetical protein LIP03_01250 [Bacteroidales bacterium]|nr:hypothetical protein [Bacteroidales bacterium]